MPEEGKIKIIKKVELKFDGTTWEAEIKLLKGEFFSMVDFRQAVRSLTLAQRNYQRKLKQEYSIEKRKELSHAESV